MYKIFVRYSLCLIVGHFAMTDSLCATSLSTSSIPFFQIVGTSRLWAEWRRKNFFYTWITTKAITTTTTTTTTTTAITKTKTTYCLAQPSALLQLTNLFFLFLFPILLQLANGAHITHFVGCRKRAHRFRGDNIHPYETLELAAEQSHGEHLDMALDIAWEASHELWVGVIVVKLDLESRKNEFSGCCVTAPQVFLPILQLSHNRL